VLGCGSDLPFQIIAVGLERCGSLEGLLVIVSYDSETPRGLFAPRFCTRRGRPSRDEDAENAKQTVLHHVNMTPRSPAVRHRARNYVRGRARPNANLTLGRNK
jgi:hypothetical protein